jgi:hypothetical protein
MYERMQGLPALKTGVGYESKGKVKGLFVLFGEDGLNGRRVV